MLVCLNCRFCYFQILKKTHCIEESDRREDSPEAQRLVKSNDVSPSDHIELSEINKNTEIDITKQYLLKIYQTLKNIDKRCKEDRQSKDGLSPWREFANCLDILFFCLFLVLFLVNVVFIVIHIHT